MCFCREVGSKQVSSKQTDHKVRTKGCGEKHSQKGLGRSRNRLFFYIYTYRMVKKCLTDKMTFMEGPRRIAGVMGKRQNPLGICGVKAMGTCYAQSRKSREAWMVGTQRAGRGTRRKRVTMGQNIWFHGSDRFWRVLSRGVM